MMSRFFICLFALLVVFSCERPVSEEFFVKSVDAEGGVYEFSIDLSDSLASYDISIYSRTDRSGREDAAVSAVPLVAEWFAPGSDSASLSEKLFLEIGGRGGMRRLYRSGVSPAEPGVWTLKMRPENVPSRFCGLGIISERKNGTR